MRKKILQIVLILVAMCQLQVFAQSTKVTGRVVGPDNAPVSGASVTVSGTTQGTYTDDNGNFTINAPAGASLLVNSIGFSDKVIKTNGGDVMNISLAAGASSGLEEVVVTGYTSQRKKDIVGSVTVVDMKSLKVVPSGSAMQALQGQAPGVEVTNSGSPAGQTGLTIRGITGFSANPLVLIDGVEGFIGWVPTSDVESMQVLKDAASASIYGARGANGVIIITTKKGKSATPVVSYDSYYNFQMPYKASKLDLLNSDEYVSLQKQVNPASQIFDPVSGNLADYFYRTSSGAKGIGFEGDAAVNPSLYHFDPTNYNNNYTIVPSARGNGTSWYDEITRNALWMDHNINVTGATEKASYLISAGYQDRQGTLVSSFNKRYNLRVNTSYKIKEHIRIGENLNIQYMNGSFDYSSNGNFGPIESAIKSLPYQSVYDIQGRYAGQFAGPSSDMGGWGNPLARLELSDANRNRQYYIIGNVYGEVDILKHFTARTSFGGTIGTFSRQTYDYAPYWEGGLPDGRLTQASGTGTKWQWTNTLNYRNTFGKHALNAIVGSEAISDESRNNTASARGFLLQSYRYLQLQSARNRIDGNDLPQSFNDDRTLFSLFGKINYTYNDRYLIDVSARRDKFSGFGPDVQAGNFYAVGAGWRISQEEFIKSVSWINDLKIRASYGSLGKNEGIGHDNAYTTYRSDPQFSYYDLNGTGNSALVGYYVRQYGNPSTSWEANNTFNIGADATLFNNKLDIVVDYYTKNVKGLLFTPPSYALAGEGRPPAVNIGDIQNKGIDLGITYRTRVNKDLDISIGANFGTYTNKITKLPLPGYFDDGSFRFAEGQSISSFFGYKVIGLFQSAEDVDKSPGQDAAAPGRLKYLDANGDDSITTADRVFYGSGIPAFTLGINLGVNWRNIDFTAQIYTVQGVDIYNGLNTQLMSFENGVTNKSRKLLNAWTPSNTNTNIKKNESGSNFSNSAVNNSNFLEDGSFVRLRSIMIGYSFQGAGLRAIGLNRLRVYLQGANLITISKYSGLDPEVVPPSTATKGLDAGAYVQSPGVVFGLNLTF